MSPRSETTLSGRNRRLKQRLKKLAAAPAEYIWNFHLRSYRNSWNFGRRIWELGWPMRSVLAALLLLAASARLVGWIGTSPDVHRAALEFIFLALCTLAFGATAAAAAGWGVWGFTLVFPWLAYFSLGSAGVLAISGGHVAIAFPIWALLLIGWRLCATERRRGVATLLWIVLAMGAGVLTSGVSGFRGALGLPWKTGGPLFGAVLAVTGVIAWRLTRRWEPGPVTFAQALTLAGGAMGCVFALSVWRNAAGTIPWVTSQFPQLDFLVTLIWFWGGGGFALALRRVVDWTTRRTVRVGLGRLMLLAPGVWVAVTGFEWWRELRAPAPGSPERYALWGHLGITVASLCLLAWSRRAGQLRARWLIDLNTFWIVSFLALHAVAAKLKSFGSVASEETATGLAVAAAMIGAIGIVARTEKDWGSAGGRNVALYAAWASAFVAILVADQLDASWRLDQQRAVQVFEGMITLGLPLVIHQTLARRSPAAGKVPVLVSLFFSVLGMITACGVMLIDHTDWRWLIAAAPLWAAILLVARIRCPRWDRLAGAFAGTMLAAGATLYWRLPATFCIPFRPAIPSESTLAVWYDARRDLGFDVQLFVTFAGLATGALCGWWVFAGRPGFAKRAGVPPAPQDTGGGHEGKGKVASGTVGLL